MPTPTELTDEFDAAFAEARTRCQRAAELLTAPEMLSADASRDDCVSRERSASSASGMKSSP